jgi:hypothetical protein
MLWPLLFVLLSAPAHAGTSNPIAASPEADRDSAPVVHIRPLSHAAEDLFYDGVTRSQVIYSLVAQLQASDEVIYLSYTFPASSETPRARTQLLSSAGGVRFLTIQINAGVEPNERLPLLAHELQHALEIAGARDVRTDADMKRLYQRIGLRVGVGLYETAAARDVERRVRQERPRR